MDLPYKWHYYILIKPVYLESSQMQDTLPKNLTL